MKIKDVDTIKFGKFTIKTKTIYGCLYISMATYKNITVQTNRVFTTKQEAIDDIINELSITIHYTIKELI